MTKPTVTLCMIVKDEEHIIRECLESIAPYIDRYDILDPDRDWETVGFVIYSPHNNLLY